MILPTLRDVRKNPMVWNLVARVGALGSLTLASLLVARTGGPAAVGDFALLRVLPWLAGVLMSFGLFGAAPYFLAGPSRTEPRIRSTIFGIALVCGAIGAVLWAVASPALHSRFFPGLPVGLVALAGVTVLTQLVESTAKASSQGLDDFVGSNRIIVLEEFLFLPAYGTLQLLGVSTFEAIVVALIVGDLCTLTTAWVRLARRGFFRAAGFPSLALAFRVIRYGARAEVGVVLLLLNARLDFIIVGAIVGPAALGMYAIASRFAELLRLPALAANYVLYPAYAAAGRGAAVQKTREMIPRMAWITIGLAVPLALAGTFVLPLLYGEAFRGAIVPTYILIAGLCGAGITGVISAFLYATDHPGLNSLAMGAGLLVTVVLDLVLIPALGVLGAALASAAAYLTTTAVLAGCFLVGRRGEIEPEPEAIDVQKVAV
jgi:O-antigen/teichoic acid export membrane protein